MTPLPLIEVCQLTFRYAEEAGAARFRLGPADFAVHPGEIVAIVGPNASGKTTLLHLLAGLLPPAGGTVLLEGRPVAGLRPRERARRIALVQQESPLLFPQRALSFVLQGRYAFHQAFDFDTPADVRLAEDALEAARGAHLARRLMQELSGGEKQRVILARALAQAPRLLLLDEPTLHLDIGFQAELLRLVARQAQVERRGVVLVTHELNLAAEFADSALLLHHGQVVRQGALAEVFDAALLEEIFEAQLDVRLDPATGRPRVLLRGAARAQPANEIPEGGEAKPMD